MARSRRLPYTAVTGTGSAKQDKQLANRGVRRRQNQYTRDVLIGNQDWDADPIPVRYECAHNDTYSWNRDGKQYLCTIDHDDLNPYHCTSYFVEGEEFIRDHEESVAWQVRWIKELQRK